MDKNLYKFGLDWLNGVLPVSDVWEVFEQLKKFSSKLRFERWELTNSGKYNYSRRYCLDGKATIQLMYNPVSSEECFTADMEHNNSGVFFSISGDGIRYLHSLGGDISALNNLLFYFYRNSFRASRFDVYCDILDSNNEVVPLIQKAFNYFQFPQVGKPTLRTNVQRKRSNCTINTYRDDNGKKFTNCTLGNHGTRFGMFRCYNKLIEMQDGRLSEFAPDVFKEYGVSDYWYRLEFEIHKENAVQCFQAVMQFAEQEDKQLCFEGIFYSVFNRIFTIIDVPSLGTNICNMPTSPAWASFGSELSASSEYLVQFRGVPYVNISLQRLDSNLDRISGYFYLALQRLLLMSPSDRQGFLLRGSDKFNSNKRYNDIRDELDILPLKDLQQRLQQFNLIA